MKNQTQSKPTNIKNRWTGHPYFGLGLISLILIIILVAIFLNSSAGNTINLPAKYQQSSMMDSTSILIDGIDPGEGVSTLYRDQKITLQTNNLKFAHDILIVLGEHEQATILKSFKTVPNGVLKTEISVPTQYKTGLTSLHIYYTLQGDMTTDRWDEVFVAASKNDYDGDGRKNSKGSCNGVVPDSHQDVDHDGQDDACDGYIGPKSNH